MKGHAVGIVEDIPYKIPEKNGSKQKLSQTYSTQGKAMETY